MMKIGRKNEMAVIFCNESKHCEADCVRTPYECSLFCLISFVFSILIYKNRVKTRYLTNCILFFHEIAAKLINSAKITRATPLAALHAQPQARLCCNNISGGNKVKSAWRSDAAACCLVLPKFLYLKLCGQMGNQGFKLGRKRVLISSAVV